MKPNPERTERKRTEIVAAALELFLERGYEETSIRMIQKKLGKEPGLFYYYFESKEEVFEAAVAMFFTEYEAQMEQLMEAALQAPAHILNRYVDYIHEGTEAFRSQYLGKLHWSVLGAIREHTLQVMLKYVQRILQLYLERGIIEPPKLGLETTAKLLAYGIGGSILYQDGESYTAQEANIKKLIPLLLGPSESL